MNYNKNNLVLFMFFLLVISFTLFMGTSPVLSKTIIKMANIDSPFSLDLAKTNGEFNSTDIKCRAFKKMIETASGGKYEVKIFPAGQLGGEREMYEMLKMQSLQMTGCSGSPVANFAPEIMAFQIPYQFKDVNVALKVMNGPLGDELNELIVKRTGIRFLYWGFEGYMNIANTKRPIAVPADLKGMKIRSSVTPNVMEILRLAGATPTSIPFNEIYTSVQQGVVDGANTCLGLHYTIKLQELIKYYSMAKTFFAWSPISINEKFYRSQTPRDQYLIKNSALKAMRVFQGMLFWGEDLWIDLFQKRGVKFSFPTPAQEQEWIKAIGTPMEKWTRNKIGNEWVDKVMKATKKAEKELYGDIK